MAQARLGPSCRNSSSRSNAACTRRWRPCGCLRKSFPPQSVEQWASSLVDHYPEPKKNSAACLVWRMHMSQQMSEFRPLLILGNRTRHVWSTLDTIRFDLAECPTLEAEVLMWRVVHHQPHESRTC